MIIIHLTTNFIFTPTTDANILVITNQSMFTCRVLATWLIFIEPTHYTDIILIANIRVVYTLSTLATWGIGVST